MRILFLCVFLINIVFFIWEYRKGAPEIYLPPSYENSLGPSKGLPQILLLTESNELQNAQEQGSQQSLATANDLSGPHKNDLALSDQKISPIIPSSLSVVTQKDIKNVDINNSIEQRDEALIAENTSNKKGQNAENIQSAMVNHGTISDINLAFFACYQIKKGEYKQQSLLQEMQDPTYKLDVFEQQRDANSYLVLTLASSSSQDALNSEQQLKQQGIKDLWLFREGLFKWRISLGLFSGIEQAEKAKQKFSEQTDLVLEVVPSYLTTTATIMKISTQGPQGIATFEQKYSYIIDQKIDCD